MKIRHTLSLLALLLTCLTAQAQRFFNLSSDEVSVDTVMPSFSYGIPLPDDYADSTYTTTIVYPEFIDMTELDIANYHRISQDTLPQMPEVSQSVVTNRRKATLLTSFCPLVFRDGRYQILVSFMLRVDAKAKATAQAKRLGVATRAAAPSERYAAHSVLASGKWAKIRVPSSGVYELTSALAKKAGFADLSKVRVYGYGGNLINEVLDGDELQASDDLKEVPTCTVNGRRLFYAKGPVSWSGNSAAKRTRNPYSDYGYYFLTTADGTPESVDTATFLASFYPSPDDYHTLVENDGYSWFAGGRNLYDSEAISLGHAKSTVIKKPAGATSGRLTVNVSAGTASTAQVSVNGTVKGNISVSLTSYDKGNERTATYQLGNLTDADTVKVAVTSGGPMRLDFISVAWNTPEPAPDLTGAFPTPEYVNNITNQDHHADAQADMVMIIPASQKLLKQARRLADFHEQHDGLRVNIVPADELYNEFSSGTPDASAYRRYMKMLYDRATTDDDMPKYLLLFGGCVWDNRMLTSECCNLVANDHLLCYESENSFNEVECYIDDGFFTYLDDGEGVNLTSNRDNKTDMSDVAVGRFPVTTEAEAKILVDKTIGYAENENAGAWQNTIMFMGDDGNDNLHMRDCNAAAEDIDSRYPGYQIRKVMWDAYTEVSTSTGNTYPEVTSIIKQQQQQGALIMDYVGHGAPTQVSHEKVLTLNDFKSFTNKNLPLWITASCDIMAFDGVEENIGEAAVLNENGGAIAFFGTTRTVYANYNRAINMAYLRYVLSQSDGKPVTIGEAQRLAKNYMITSGSDKTCNKLQYSLLGDPALPLNIPTGTVVIDSINGQPTVGTVRASAGSKMTVAGHVEDGDGYNGTVTLQVLDSRQLVTCRENASAQVSGSAFTFYNRTKTVFSGTSYVSNGRFAITFTLPYDLNYDGGTGLAIAFAVKDDHSSPAHGSSSRVILGSADQAKTDTVGPKIYCYLNSPDFTNGGDVNATPYFAAQLSDESGINATGNGIGHDLELVVDGLSSLTYNINDNFQYDIGSSTTGSTYYNIPALEPGRHTLVFRAWDVLNNVSTSTLDFNVIKSLAPTISSVSVSDNPATTSTTFIVAHNFGGNTMDVVIDVFDMSGRLLWTHKESGAQAGSAYTVDWDLTQDNGAKMPTGVYLYRVRLASDGSSMATKAKKLVIINNN